MPTRAFPTLNAKRGPKKSRQRDPFPPPLQQDRLFDIRWAAIRRDWTEELLAGDAVQPGWERCAFLASLSGVAAQPIWQWGFVERVSTGLLALKVGAEAIGRDMLEVADLWSLVGRDAWVK
jgi:streptomycin 6-kinase